MVKKLGAIASVEDIRPHHFRHDLGTTITCKRVAPLYSKELMRIKSDKVYCLGLLEYVSDHKTTFGQ